MEKATVSILLATYNSEKYIVQQLESLINQTYKDIIITVCDDGSTDGTVETVKKFAEKDSRIRLLDTEKKFGNAQGNFMFLLKNSENTPYYMFCDHDDKWLENKVEITLDKMLQIEEKNVPCIVHTDLFVTDGALNIISDSMFRMQKLSKENSFAKELIQNNITGCTMMINNALKTLALKKSDTENIIMHDWFLGLIGCGMGKVAFLDVSTIYYRQHGDNQVGAKDAGSAQYIMEKAKDKSGNRNSLKKTMKQAKMFAELYKTELKDNYEIAFAYGEMLNKNKISRLLTCAKYGFWKNTFLRKIGQLLYI